MADQQPRHGDKSTDNRYWPTEKAYRELERLDAIDRRNQQQ